MKKLKILIAVIFTAIVCINFSCNSNIKTQNIPNVLIADTLTNVYDYKVTDTFDKGEVRRIRFYEKNNMKSSVYEKRYYENGKICMEGGLDSDSLRNGRWIAWYDCGKVWSVGDFKHGLKHGENMVYYVNGQVQYTKNYVNDTADGYWHFYNEQGVEVAQVIYEKGNLIKQINLLEKNDTTVLKQKNN